MTRLTVSMKQELIEKALVKAFEKENEFIGKLEKDILEYKEKYFEYVKNNYLEPSEMKLVNSIPDDWLKKKPFFVVMVENRGIQRIDLKERVLKLPYKYHGYSPPATRVITENDNLFKMKKEYELKQEKIQQEKSKIHEAKCALKNQITSVLKNISTVKQLEEKWPEMFKLYSPYKGTFLVSNIESLNQKIGI